MHRGGGQNGNGLIYCPTFFFYYFLSILPYLLYQTIVQWKGRDWVGRDHTKINSNPFFRWFSTLLSQSRWRQRRWSGPIFRRSYGRRSETASTTASTFSGSAASARHGAPPSPLFSNPLLLPCPSASLLLPPPRMAELFRLNLKLYSFKSQSTAWNR